MKPGKEYAVLALILLEGSGLQIYTESDNYNDPRFFDLDGFEFINQNIPESWITVISEFEGKKVMTMLPASWNYEDFFEDVFEEKQDAIALYNLEAEKIFHEEGMEFIPKEIFDVADRWTANGLEFILRDKR